MKLQQMPVAVYTLDALLVPAGAARHHAGCRCSPRAVPVRCRAARQPRSVMAASCQSSFVCDRAVCFWRHGEEGTQ